MLNAKTFLSLDCGAGTLKLAEFEVTEAGGLRLIQFGTKPLGLLGAQDTAREALLKKVLTELATERPVTGRIVNVCAPGYQVFSKFIKLPPVDTSKAAQIIQYEAQQNIPFPLSEVVWDYQKVGTSQEGEMEVLLVAIKSEQVEGLYRVNHDTGRSLQLVDVSVSALSNAFRYTYGQNPNDPCVMLIDVGAKTTDVLFFEKGRIFSRALNIGANAITQEFAAEVKLPFAQAEQFKITEGFVSLGGAFEEPDNPKQAAVSKVARNVFTRLHIQLNQTIQHYQKQTGGSAPTKVYLSGGGTTLPYTAEFFKEKFNVPVEYFNPLQNVEIGENVDLEELQRSGHCTGELVGLALRNLAECPIELNLVPRRVLESQKIAQKKPFFYASVAALVIGLFALGWFYDAKVVKSKEIEISKYQERSDVLRAPASELSDIQGKIEASQNQLSELSKWVDERFLWTDIVRSLQKALEETEDEVGEELTKEIGSNVITGLWIEKMLPELPDLDQMDAVSGEDGEATSSARQRRASLRRGRTTNSRLLKQLEAAGAGAAEEAAKPVNTNEIQEVKLICKAVNLKMLKPTANDQLAFNLESKIKDMTNLFNPVETGLMGQAVMTNSTADTFSFDIKLKLKTPIKI